MSEFSKRGGGGGEHRPPTSHIEKEQAPEVLRLETSIQWEEDTRIEARGEKMMEVARGLKCERASQVMIGMLQWMDNGIRPGNLYCGPTEKMINDQTRMHRRLDHEDYLHFAWSEVHRTYGQFDLPNIPRSDWGRTVGVFKAAIFPAEGINGVFHVSAPKLGEKGDEHWQRFSVWCEERRLNAYGLWQVAQGLLTKGIKPSQADEISKELDSLTAAQLDKIVLAGYSEPEDLLVLSEMDNGYKSLSGLLQDLDQERQDKDYEKAAAVAKKAREEFLKPHASFSTGRKVWVTHSYDAKYHWDALWRQACDLYDRVLNEELGKLHVDEQVIHPVDASVVAASGLPTAAIIARRGRVGDRFVGFGIHPVSPEAIAAMAGTIPGAIHELRKIPGFSLEHGGVVTRQAVTLGSRAGTRVKTRVETGSGEEAVKVFANQLVDTSNWKIRGALEDELPFILSNETLVAEDNLVQWRARSQGCLETDFDLESWYEKQLIKLGNITTIAGAKAHAQELILTLDDVFPGQKEVVEEVERNYPAAITITSHSYPIRYRYVSEEEAPDKRAKFSATIKVTKGEPQSSTDILDLPSITQLTVGTPDQPLPIQFELWKGGFAGSLQETGIADIVHLQELLDVEKRRQAWEIYSEKEKTWRIATEVEKELPRAEEVVTDKLSSYYNCPNGEQLYPVPAATRVVFENGIYYVEYGLARTSSEAAKIEKQARYFHKKNQERAERLKDMDTEKANTLRTRANELMLIIEAITPENIFAHNSKRKSLKQSLERVSEFLDEGEMGSAERFIRDVEKDLQNVEEIWKLFLEGEQLIADCKQRSISCPYDVEHFFERSRYIEKPILSPFGGKARGMKGDSPPPERGALIDAVEKLRRKIESH